MARRKLPTDRPGFTKRIVLRYMTDTGQARELEICITTGCYEDGGVGEIFLKADRAGTTISGLLDALSITASIALQHGVPLGLLVEKWSRMQFHPAGRTTDPEIGLATSVVDAVARYLAKRYLPPEPAPEAAQAPAEPEKVG